MKCFLLWEIWQIKIGVFICYEMMGTGGGNVPVVLGVGIKEGIVGTLDASYFKGPGARGGIERTMVS